MQKHAVPQILKGHTFINSMLIIIIIIVILLGLRLKKECL